MAKRAFFILFLTGGMYFYSAAQNNGKTPAPPKLAEMEAVKDTIGREYNKPELKDSDANTASEKNKENSSDSGTVPQLQNTTGPKRD
ncbi:MAG: hypothetical protein AB1458_08610 [Bacteroidota bacterium]